jgi:hypothetical protein
LGNKLGGLGKLAGGLAAGGIAALGAAAVGVGKHAFDMAVAYDDALDAITVATGASGKALDDMGEAVKRLYTGAAGRGQSLSGIAEVMGQVSARTKATGPALETFTSQVLKLSTVTGTQANANVETLTKLMGAFNIPLAEAAPLMDTLFVATQKTGQPLDQLIGDLESAAPIASAFGLSIDESAGLLAVFEANGVPAAAAVTGLRTVMAGWAEDGITPSKDALSDLVAQIAGPDGMNVAIDAFGAKAGPGFFTLIRDGKLDVDNLAAALGPQGMKGAIDEVITRTGDYPQSWEDAKHKIEASLTDVGGYMLDFLNEYGPPFAEWFAATVPEAIDQTLTALDKFLEKIKQPAEGEYGAGQNPYGKQMLDWMSEGLTDRAEGMHGLLGRTFVSDMGSLLKDVSGMIYPTPPEYSGKPYPSGGGDVPYYDSGYDPNAGAGAQTYMVGYDSSGKRYTVVYQTNNVYGDVNDPRMFEQMTRGEGVR